MVWWAPLVFGRGRYDKDYEKFRAVKEASYERYDKSEKLRLENLLGKEYCTKLIDSKEQAKTNADRKSNKIFFSSLLGSLALGTAIPYMFEPDFDSYAVGLCCSTMAAFPILGVSLYLNEKYQKEGYKKFIKEIPKNCAKEAKDYLWMNAGTNSEQQLIENMFKILFRV
jgi:hypothetical protein